MMRLLILLLALFTVSLPVMAQDTLDDDPTPRGLLEKPQGLNPAKPLTNEATDRVYKQCRSFYPKRFTPSALDYYCTCTAAATQGILTTGEYESIQIERNRRVDNPVYEKYVTQVIAPCMDVPTLDVEYYSCVLNRKLDPGIRDIITYCQCMSQKMSSHVQKYGDSDVMSRLDNELNNDPLEAMWNSGSYRKAKQTAGTECRRGNWKSPSVYN